MQEKREIDNVDAFEKSLGDRIYLGILILFGFIFGSGIFVILASCFIKVNTGVWPTWL